MGILVVDCCRGLLGGFQQRLLLLLLLGRLLLLLGEIVVGGHKGIRLVDGQGWLLLLQLLLDVNGMDVNGEECSLLTCGSWSNCVLSIWSMLPYMCAGSRSISLRKLSSMSECRTSLIMSKASSALNNSMDSSMKSIVFGFASIAYALLLLMKTTKALCNCRFVYY